MAGLSMLNGLGRAWPLAPPPSRGTRLRRGSWRGLDSFNGPADSGVSTKYWEYNTGHGVFGTNEVETMTNSKYNVHMDGHGNLDLIVLGHGAAGSPEAAWTSGRIETRGNRLFGAPAGGEMMVTASIKQPAAAHALGDRPGFWMLGRTAWPGTGEIDIMENVDGYSKTSGTLHCGNLTQKNPDGTLGPCHETQRPGQWPAGLRGMPALVPYLLADHRPAPPWP